MQESFLLLTIIEDWKPVVTVAVVKWEDNLDGTLQYFLGALSIFNANIKGILLANVFEWNVECVVNPDTERHTITLYLVAHLWKFAHLYCDDRIRKDARQYRSCDLEISKGDCHPFRVGLLDDSVA